LDYLCLPGVIIGAIAGLDVVQRERQATWPYNMRNKGVLAKIFI
jgi:hypothetical protein